MASKSDFIKAKRGSDGLKAYLPPTKGKFTQPPELIRMGLPTPADQKEPAE